MHEGRVLHSTLVALDHFRLLIFLLLLGLYLIVLQSVPKVLHLVLLRLGRLLICLLGRCLRLGRLSHRCLLCLVLLVLRLEYFLQPNVSEDEQDTHDAGRDQANDPKYEHAVASFLELALVDNIEEHALHENDNDQAYDPVDDGEYVP
jgi:hypothetical protein